MASSESATRSIAVIGAGPRGLSVIERICANAPVVSPGVPVTLEVVEPFAAGSGRVWRTDQPHDLLMNTVASQITIFTDESVELEGPVAAGPSLHAWARALSSTDRADTCAQAVREEARRLGPDSYPSRAFYGAYLEWAYEHIVAAAPEQVTVHRHRARAVRLTDRADGRQEVELDGGVVLSGLDAVVLAQGHTDTAPSGSERVLADHAERRGSMYIPPSNPADADLTGLSPGSVVALRGLGLNFFDYMALLSTGRGGTFRPGDRGLVYEPSGEEPRLVAGSRRGIPHHARGENEKGVSERHSPLFLTPGVIDRFRERAAAGRPADFRRDVWPLASKEVEGTYYAALIARREDRDVAAEFLTRYVKVVGAAEPEEPLLLEFSVGREDHWDWNRLQQPYEGRDFEGIAGFNAWLVDHLRADAAMASQGNVTNPLKAALDVLRDLRNEIRLVVDHGGITGSSYRADLDHWYTPLNAFLSIGPPVRRIREMTALVEAGVLTLVGPGMTVRADAETGGFAVTSRLIRASAPVRVAALIEARLPGTDLRTTRDPLMSDLLAAGRCRPYDIGDPSGPGYRTGGLSVTGRPYRVIDAGGRPHPARFAYGVPTEHVHWVTAAGVRPGVNSVTLGDSDAIARAALTACAAIAGAGTAVPGTVRDIGTAQSDTVATGPAAVLRHEGNRPV
ncbi:FAD/NAD(P)-binding protein [Streptomyces hiroshimensis]|nr:FAD/NAD(P)-binding protein [Streptomyces hiroshimensis]